MRIKIPKTKIVWVYCLALFLVYQESFAQSGARKLTEKEVAYLVKTYHDEHYDEKDLKRIFSDLRLRFIPGLVKRNVLNRKEQLNDYQRFFSLAALARAGKFTKEWDACLNNTAGQFGVDREVIVAVISVESSLGKYLGKNSVMSIFTSIVLENREKRREEIAKDMKDGSQKDRYFERLTKKAKWAKGELKSLLKMKMERKIDINRLKGSYSGAFGIPQFLPSSYLKWGYDGDGNDSVDLFFMPDAIASVGCYLKAHGWRSGLDYESNKKVLFRYNNSNAYVEAVLIIANKLKESSSH